MNNSFTVSKAILFFFFLCFLTFISFSNNVIAKNNKEHYKESDLNEILVTGIVKDENGITLPGASILVKGTTTGTITDIDGNYKINVKPNDTLIFSYIGYQPQAIEVNSQTVINVSLVPDQEVLDEVVVVGYGVQKKKSVVGAIEQTSGEDLLEAGGGTDFTSTLEGQVAGMTVQQSSAAPGENNTSIFIRGKSSWTDNSPLVLVDGIERNFNDIDPNEIESFSVLKDASATAVFGVKGANGVLLITTKQGKSEKTSIKITTEVGFKEPTNNYQRLSVPDSYRLMNEAMMADGNWESLIPESLINQWEDPNRDLEKYPDVNWWDEVVGTGIQYKTNLNLSGGTKKVNYFTSIGYVNEEDILKSAPQAGYDPSFTNQRINFRSNVNFKLTKNTELKVGIAGNNKEYNSPRAVSESSWHREQFFQDIYRAPSDLHPAQFDNGSYGWVEGSTNPLMQLNGSGSKSTRRSELYTNVQLRHNFTGVLEGFSLQGKVAFDTYNQFTRNITFEPETYSYQQVPVYDPATGGEILVDSIMTNHPNFTEKPAINKKWNHSYYRKTVFYEFSARYSKDIGKHHIGLLGLFSRRINEAQTSFPQYEENWAGRLTYDYNTKYLAEINLGVNGSDNFAPGKRYGIFPSFALGWVLSEESFVRDNVRWLNFFKVRYSYGTVGRSHINDNTRYLYYGQYYTQDSKDWRIGEKPYKPSTHYFEGRIPNEDATWEKALKQNLGFETTIFENISLNLDLYNEHRYDILMERRSIPTLSGFSQDPYANIGEVKSRGFEISGSYVLKLNKRLKFTFSPNYSFNESRIINRDDPVNLPDYLKEAGKPIGSTNGYLTDGLYQSWDDIYNSPQTNFGNVTPGDIKYTDFNSDGQVDVLDNTVIKGLNFPTTTYGLKLGINYGNFNMSALFYGVQNSYANINGDLMWGFTKGYNNVDETHRNTWSPSNPDPNANPRLHFANEPHNKNTTSYTWQNTSYLRLKNIHIGYNLKPKNKNLFKSLYIYFSGNNLFTFTEFDSRLDPANSNKSYPLVRLYTVGARLNIR
ncbi:SusC/RagA family TonB-linked outer membrane protein [Flammeovirga agarivorans]|uniref:TonB-dependent receptor n=1 Tax=Flammeovirga agarivorans TaxID=2726742 RepID=A0A7X8XXR0_9BACT|nr:TonB-dependent receptor [Flammeovirga agarivorans]NLR93467.1 TonB-dependent receptor [Flammeovirga agarivorans]